MINKLKDEYSLECNWDIVLPVYNSINEKNRVIKINPNLKIANYPLTRNYLNEYFKTHKFNFSNYSSFIYDCAASMYSFFIMTYGYKAATGGNTGNQALPAVPGGQGISFGFNPFFGVINLDSPILWILLAVAGVLIFKKVIE